MPAPYSNYENVILTELLCENCLAHGRHPPHGNNFYFSDTFVPFSLTISYFILGISLVNSISLALQCESILLRENLNVMLTLPLL